MEQTEHESGGTVAPFGRRGTTASPPPSQRAESLATQLAELEQRGVPPGAWLLDIARTRRALQEAETLLLRLEDAIVRGASSAPLDGT